LATGINHPCRHATSSIETARNQPLDRVTTCKGVDSRLTETFLPFFLGARARTAVNDPTALILDNLPIYSYTVGETPCKGLLGHIDTEQ